MLQGNRHFSRGDVAGLARAARRYAEGAAVWHRCQAMVLHGEVVICNFFNDRWPAIAFG